MKLNFAKYKILQVAAFFGALIIHAGIVLSSMIPSNPLVINQQVIQVSFVAPSGSKTTNETDYRKKIVTAFKSQNITEKLENSLEKKSQDKKILGKETSGLVDEKSQELNSAESEPVFNAQYLNNSAPKYPTSARKRGIEGKVLLEVAVKIDGAPSLVVISHSSGHQILDDAALNAVKNWRFVPAKKLGKPIEASVIVPVEFKLI
jgi:TonB family protein